MLMGLHLAALRTAGALLLLQFIREIVGNNFFPALFCVYKGEKSALADHVIKTNHDIAWDEATILRTNSNWHQREILEAWEINCAKDPLNRDDGALLPKEYLHLTLANKKK